MMMASDEYSVSTNGSSDVKGAVSAVGTSVGDGDRDKEESEDETQELVRSENNAVICLRIVVMIVLLAAAVAAAASIYLSTTNLELKAFHDAIQTVSTNILRAFQSDLSLKFYMAQSAAAAISGAIEGRSKTNTTVNQFERIFESQRTLHKAVSLYWSPYLSSLQERVEFEAYASSTETGELQKAHPPCHFCGSPALELVRKESLVDVLGGQQFQCGAIEGAALSGVFSPERCEAGQQTISETCGCKERDIDLGNLIAVNRTLEEGLFSMGDFEAIDDVSSPPYHPIWQISGSDEAIRSVLYNQQSEPRRARALEFLVKEKLPVISETYTPDEPFYRAYGRNSNSPTAIVYYPVFDERGREGDVIGSVAHEFEWKHFVTSVYPPGSEDADIVISNSCKQKFTFKVENIGASSGKSVLNLKTEGDTHDPNYSSHGQFRTFDDYENDRQFAAFTATGAADFSIGLSDPCRYSFAVYPTSDMEEKYRTSTPTLLATFAGAFLCFAGIMFLIYDRFVTVRQRKVMISARRTNAIVSSLFPANVRTRLFETNGNIDGDDKRLDSIADKESRMSSDPIADFFPATTILFLDIAGFTAWSSEREPTQVFKLLEALYQQFDELARKMGIFKVETIGDSYVAVTGLPDPRPQHAVVMARFAVACMKKFRTTVRRLEIQLGPSTADLRGRCGLHSGPVTAGVLRGDKARFQLFGDTMNTASRMESTGVSDMIHVSAETAQLLRDSGKGNWLVMRQDQVEAKGLGQLTTFFLVETQAQRRYSNFSSADNSGVSSALRSEDAQSNDTLSDNITEIPFWSDESKRKMSKSEIAKCMRLVDWNVELLYKLLARIVTHRAARDSATTGASSIPTNRRRNSSCLPPIPTKVSKSLVADQVVEVIDMPKYDSVLAAKVSDMEEKQYLDPKVREELHEFVTQVATMYRGNAFHSFDHASHVTMSASKLLRRIVAPSGSTSGKVVNGEQLHHSTYGISSDPLMQFAIVMATLIHDLDHRGLPNTELVRLRTPMAVVYGNRSVAEQNSLDLAWALLTKGTEFANLCRAIFATTAECDRFRQLLVNAVMATDIADKDLQKRRKERWNLAFSPENNDGDREKANSRKATIVMDYIVQASDVSHTMQHFLTYRKWNLRLFKERYRAWKSGNDTNPADSWYQGEIGFFDFYVIPLAMKLKECGVFGVSHDEYLNYALSNRMEWKKRGEQIVQELVQAVENPNGSKDAPTADSIEILQSGL